MEFARICKANQEALELTQQQSEMEAMIAVRRLSSTQTSLSSSQKAIFTLRRDVNGVVSALSEMNRLFQQEMSSVKRKVTTLYRVMSTLLCLILGYLCYFRCISF